MTDTQRMGVAPLDLIITKAQEASGGLPDTWQKYGVVDRRQVAAVRARVAAASKLFSEARAVRPNIDFTRSKTVKSVVFVDAPMDDDFDW